MGFKLTYILDFRFGSHFFLGPKGFLHAWGIGQPPLIRKRATYSTYSKTCDICERAGVGGEKKMVGWKGESSHLLPVFWYFLSQWEKGKTEFWFVFAKHGTLNTQWVGCHNNWSAWMYSLQSCMKFKTVQMSNKRY